MKHNINEDYPSSWDMEKFVSIDDEDDRLAYAKQHLTRLGCGSARCVFDVDGEKVLKIAKVTNKISTEGIAQNLREISWAKDPYISIPLPDLYDYDENGKWLELDKVEPFQDESEWENYFGYPFEAFVGYLKHIHEKTAVNYLFDIYKKYRDEVSEDDFAYDMSQFISSTGLSVKRKKYGRIVPDDYFIVEHYGLDNNNDPKLIDFGLDWDIFDEFYLNNPKGW